MATERRKRVQSYYVRGARGSNRVITVECMPDETKTGEVSVRAVPVTHQRRVSWFTSGFE